MVNHRPCNRLLRNRYLPHFHLPMTRRPMTDPIIHRSPPNYGIVRGILNSLRLLLLAVFFTIAAPLTANAAFTASVNRTSLASHETVELTLRTDESSGAAPDLTPLEWNFDILGTRQKSQTSIINGKRTYSRDWVVTLAPKQQGAVIIPPITLGDQQSEPITLTVSDQKADDSAGDTGPALMQGEVSSKSIYVQQELLFTLRILFSVPLYDDNRLSAMDISDALIQQLGETRKLDTIIDGIRYQGFELKYSIHPQSPGELIIPSLTFTGVAAEPRDPFASMFSSGGKPVIARSPEISIEVKPRPDNYPANEPWLPARNLTIQEKWSQPLSSVKVGDAITRTVTVKAWGLSAAQLPPVLMAQPEGVNSYPDKSATEDLETANGVQGQRTDSIAMIPTRSGKITLPAIDYTWFDTESGEVKTARLPAIEIDVAADPSANALPPPLVVDSPTTTPTHQAVECPPSTMPPDQPVDKPALWQTPGFWQCLTALFALFWLGTLGIWRFRSAPGALFAQANSNTNDHRFRETPSEADAFTRLEAACQGQDVPLALKELKNWCHLYLKNNNLSSLTDCLVLLGSGELNAACNQLSASLYATPGETIDTEAQLKIVLAICREIRDKKSEREKDQKLGKLYPE